MTNNIRGVLFDKDGTLFDFARTWESWAAAFLQRLEPNVNQRADVGEAIGFDIHTRTFARDSVVIADTPVEIAEALKPFMPQMSLDAILDLLNEEAARAPQAEAVPLRPLLTGLSGQGMRLGVATNDTEMPARAHLSSAGITELFDFIAGCDSGHGAKPGPGQLLAFCSAMELAPETCVMVGDSRHDLAAGRAAGFVTVGVLTGFASHDELSDLADVVFPNVGHLPKWLGAQQPV